MKSERQWLRQRRLAALPLLGLVLGCGDAGEPAGPAAVEAQQQAVNNGDDVASNSAPFSSVVRLMFLDGAGDEAGTCTATRFGSNPIRYLTAAHCLQGDNFDFVGPGDKIDISSALSGVAQGTEVTVSAVYLHPSYMQDWDGAGDKGFPSDHSYDVALLDIQGSQGPGVSLGFLGGHVGDGVAVMQVGYGADNFDLSDNLRKQSARYTVASQQQVGANAADYAHHLFTSEAGAGRQSAAGGDSGGPLLQETSPGVWRVIGVAVSSNTNSSSAPDPAISSYARVANVGRWLNAPHNNLAALNGVGFLQNVAFRQCLRVQSSTPGTRARLSECEGYDPSIHPVLWQLVASGSFYQIKMARSGISRCLGMIGTTNDVGVFECGTGTDQQWTIAPFSVNANQVTVRNRARSRYLSTTTSGGNLSVSLNSESTWLWYR